MVNKKLQLIILFSSMLLSSGAAIAQVRTIIPNSGTPPLIIYVPTEGQKQAAGCSPAVWAELQNNFVERRMIERQKQMDIQVKEQSTPPIPPGGAGGAGGAGGRSCFENATRQINSTVGGLNNIVRIFSGNIDWNAVRDQAIGQITTAACNQVDRQLGQMTSGILNPINDITRQAGGTIRQVTNPTIQTTVGDVRLRDVVTVPTGTPNTIPHVNTTVPVEQTAREGANTLIGRVTETINEINPFIR